MKKFRTKMIILIMTFVLLSAVPFFGGCDTKIKLNQPAFVEFQINEGTGSQMLVTDNNIFASGFVFGIATSYDGESVSNFFTYKTDKPYLDVTNIMINTQKYYFYARAIGSGNYVSSKISDVYTYTIQHKLDAPTLTLSGTMLSWNNVDNASIYVVYANDVVVNEVSGTSYDISAFVERNNQYVPYNFTVACKQNGNYLKSADSNSVTYTDHLKLATPENLSVQKTRNGEVRTLSWSEVANCNKYEVLINNVYTVTVEGSTSVDVSEFYTDLGEYTFRVRAVGEGYFRSSDYSNEKLDIYNSTLGTPQNVRCVVNGNNVEISWDSVNNAQEYLLFIDGEQYVLNDNTGVDSPIVTSSIILSFDELGISQSSQLDNITIEIQAKGYNYYLDSEKSYGKTVVQVNMLLSAPEITLDEENEIILFEQVENAVEYEAEVSKSLSKDYITIRNVVEEDGKVHFDYTNYLIEPATYTVRIRAIATKSEYNSYYSNSVEVVIEEPYVELNAPQINNVYVDGDSFVVEFDCDENSNDFSLFVNGTLAVENITKTNNEVLVTLASGMSNTNDIEFTLQANAYDHFLQSNNSNVFVVSKYLETPQNIKLSGSKLTWSSVKNAQTYVVALDDQLVDLQSTQTSVDLSTLVDENETRQVLVYAKCNGLYDSDYTSKLIYNRVSTNRKGYTNKYFYYGKTYDYYLTSQQEFNDLVQYSVSNQIETNKVYVDYDTTTTIKDKFNEAIEALTGTYSISCSVSNGTSKIGEAEVKLTYSTITVCENPSEDTLEYPYETVYKSQTGRDSDYDDFVTDGYIVSQDVYTTDGLVSAVENCAKPNFITKDSLPEQIYNKAKEILNQIVDNNMTDYQKALAIHDYLCSTIVYDSDGLANTSIGQIGYFHYVESALLYGLAVCDGYAKSFSLLCNMEGIKTIVISGATDKDNKSNTGHAWNKVYLDADGDGTKEWLIVDCTWDDTSTTIGSTRYEILMHDYFMISDSYVSKRYEDADYPVATMTNATYYDKYKLNGTISLKIDTLSQLNALKNYVSQNSNISGVEALVSTSYSHYTSSYLRYVYPFDSNYYIVYIS